MYSPFFQSHPLCPSRLYVIFVSLLSKKIAFFNIWEILMKKSCDFYLSWKERLRRQEAELLSIIHSCLLVTVISPVDPKRVWLFKKETFQLNCSVASFSLFFYFFAPLVWWLTITKDEGENFKRKEEKLNTKAPLTESRQEEHANVSLSFVYLLNDSKEITAAKSPSAAWFAVVVAPKSKSKWKWIPVSIADAYQSLQ
jgi:hypothetical protein